MTLFPSPDETIAGTAEALKSGRRTCVAVVERCLANIDEREHEVRAWVLVDRDGALRRARELDAELAAGKCLGPMHGIPVGIKDIVDVAGWATTAGFDLWKDRIASKDAAVVSNLRDAGAIILGKTVTTQFACYDPPPTRNPWNSGHTPGGSSSGSAAAVACGMCLGSVGSQTGGSITRPAAFCGIAGCKPTHGRVSLEGIVPLASSLDHPGPMARSVHDMAIMLEAMVQSPEARGESKSSGSGLWTLDSRLSTLDSPPTIGRLHSFFDDMAHPQMTAALDTALKKLESAGAKVRDVNTPPSFDDVLRWHKGVMSAEVATFHEETYTRHRDSLGPAIRKFIEEGQAVSAGEYIRGKQQQQQLRVELAEVFDDGLDLFACPAALGPAPDTTTTGNPSFNAPWSFTGWPTVSFPIGLASNGLPLAIQLVGRPWEERDLFRAAAWCESVLRGSL